MIQLDKKDQGIVKRLEAEWNAEGGPRVGDFVKFSNGGSLQKTEKIVR